MTIRTSKNTLLVSIKRFTFILVPDSWKREFKSTESSRYLSIGPIRFCWHLNNYMQSVG
jgi:hypothetical protein